MNKTTRTKLQFILAGIIMLSFAVVGCNDTKKEKTVTIDTTKMNTPVIDTSMEKMTGDSAPRPGGGG